MSKRNKRLGVGIIFTILATVMLFNIQVNDNSMFNKKRNSSDMSKHERREQRKKDYLEMKKWQFNRLKDPKTNSIPANIRVKELAFAKKLPTAKMHSLIKGNQIADATWASEGPINQGGRTKAVIPDIMNENILLAAAAEGGVWRSTDNGSSWLSVTDPSFIQNTTCLAQDTRAGKTNTWYYGTGEYASNLMPDGNGLNVLLGNGLFKSVDNGLTWNPIESTQSNSPGNTVDKFQIVWNIDINESNSFDDEIWVACFGGVYGSLDGGETWPLSKNGSDGELIPIYTSVSVTAKERVYAALSSGKNSGIYYSDDGSNWETITPTFWPAEVRRIVIASAESNSNILYVLSDTPGIGTPDLDGEKTSLWKYDASSNTWLDLSNNLPTAVAEVAGYSSQAGYDMCIDVKPDDENFVIIGGTNLYRTTDGFATKLDSNNWIGGYATSNNIDTYKNHHADQHGFFFLASNPNVVYSSHDGGISKSNDITAQIVTWSSLNDGYITTQFWSVAINHVIANQNIIIGGLQDNGSMGDTASNTQSNWDVIGSGDGMVAAVPDDLPWIYYSMQNGDIIRTNSNTGVQILVKPAKPHEDDFSFKTPYILDANNTDVMFLGASDEVWRNSNLTEIPIDGDNPTKVNWQVFNEVVDNNSVTALSTTKAKANLLYVGDDEGKIYKIENAADTNSSFVNISGANFPEANISSIATDPKNGNNILVAFSNYNVLSLFSTNDGGETWSCVGGNIEDYPNGIGNSPSIRDVKILPVEGGYIYLAATSIGLYTTSTLDGENTIWALEAPDQMGNVVVETIDVRPIDGRVVVGTFGKGVFSTNYIITDIDDKYTQPTEFSLSQNYPNPFNPSTTIKFSIPKRSNVKLEVFNSLGEKVATLLNEQKTMGEHSIRFNGKNLASGLYIYKITTSNFTESKKMTLIK